MASRMFSTEEVVSILLNYDENEADDKILAEGSDEEFEDITEYDYGR